MTLANIVQSACFIPRVERETARDVQGSVAMRPKRSGARSSPADLSVRHVLTLGLHYERGAAHWAILENENPVVLFPATAAGHQRATKLLTEVRGLLTSVACEQSRA